MKKIFTAVLLLLIQQCIFAQDKLLSMEDAMLKARTSLAPQNLSQLQFYGNTNDYVYLKKVEGKDIWMRGNFKMKADSAFLTLDKLNNFLSQNGLTTAKEMPLIKFTPKGWIMTSNGHRILVDPEKKSYVTLLKKELAAKENAEQSSVGYVAYLDNHNLYVTDGTIAKQVTTDGSKNIVYASSVHRDEFGINKGTFWSNNGTKLAFYRMDQGMVTDYPIINWSERPAKADLIKYPMAGDKSHHVTIGVYNTATQNIIWNKIICG